MSSRVSRVSAKQLGIALAFLAILPAIPAPIDSWPTLESPLGYWLYLVSTLTVSIALAYATLRDARARERLESERDSLLATRLEDITQTQASHTATLTSIHALLSMARPVVQQTGPTGAPLLQAIELSEISIRQSLADRQAYVAAQTAMHGYASPPDRPYRGPAGSLAGDRPAATGATGPTGPNLEVDPGEVNRLRRAATLLNDIVHRPPTDPAAVQEAAQLLRQYVLQTARGDYNLTGSDVLMSHRAADGTVLGEG